MEKTQREYYLNEQMKAIQKELGDGEEGRDEMAELEDKIAKTKLSKEAAKRLMRRFKKLKTDVARCSAEATVVRNYLDWLLGHSVGQEVPGQNDLLAAESVLDDRSLWPGEGQGAHRRISLPYRAVQTRSKDRSCVWSVLPVSVRRRLANRLPGNGSRICPHVAGRRAG